jgi:MFS family permease
LAFTGRRAVNAYLLSLSALFAFGGRLADTVGHRKMVTLGVIVFAGASALCGLTPKGQAAAAWIVAGLVLLVAFYFVEMRTESPLMRVSIFRIRPFGVCATTSSAR